MDVGAVEDAGGLVSLLTRLGGYATALRGQRLTDLALTPLQAEALASVAARPGAAQRELAELIGVPPSRLVAVADDLERRELIERRRNPDDRRVQHLYPTARGRELAAQIGRIAERCEAEIVRSLGAGARAQLERHLREIAADLGV